MTKSDHYQYRIVEIQVENFKLYNFPNEASISSQIDDRIYSDKLKELRNLLIIEIYNIVGTNALTEHQKKVLKLTLEGKTQSEIGKELGVNQSAIHKCIAGNLDYTKGKEQTKRYGGLLKKIRRIASGNPRVQLLLKQIEICKIIPEYEFDDDDEQ